MSEIKVNSIKGVGASAAAITVNNTDGTCTANITNNLSNRNLIINGAMEVAQRGTSSTSTGYVSLDRWYLNLSGGSATFSQETNPNPSETTGIQKFARLNVSSSSDFTHIRQRIEDVTKVPSGTVTLSFYAKGTAPAGGLYVYTEQSFGSGGSSSVDGTPVLITSSLTSNWVRYTAQITVASIDGKTIGTGSYFGVAIGQYSNTSSTAYDLNITGVQLEVGSVATDFEHRSFGQDLALCQRYFQFIGKEGTNAGVAAGFTTTTNFYGYGCLPSGRMRAAPTIAVSGTLSHLSYTHTAVSRTAINLQNLGSGRDTYVIQITGNASTTDNAGAYARIVNASSALTFSSEL